MLVNLSTQGDTGVSFTVVSTASTRQPALFLINFKTGLVSDPFCGHNLAERNS